MSEKETESKTEKLIYLDGVDMLEFCGAKNVKLDELRRGCPNVSVVVRGDWLKASADAVSLSQFERRLQALMDYYREHNVLPLDMVKAVVEGKRVVVPTNADVVLHTVDGRPIKARNINQQRMMECIDHDDMLFAVGPAGSGKTYFAIALAVRALKAKQIRRIILSRPAVEAGEKLGFLPGDMKEKIDPYLQPLYDALEDMIPAAKLRDMLEDKTIEIAPLAFMRGRTLSNAFVILDEAQNATMQQMKMFLTRMGYNAKFVITGDPSQADLAASQANSLETTCRRLVNIQGISIIRFAPQDIVRHKLVQRIVDAFDRAEHKTDSTESIENGLDEVNNKDSQPEPEDVLVPEDSLADRHRADRCVKRSPRSRTR